MRTDARPRMPHSGWLAVGAVAMALAGPALCAALATIVGRSDGTGPRVVAIVAFVTAVIAMLAAIAGGAVRTPPGGAVGTPAGGPARRRATGAALAGAALVAVRIALGGSGAPAAGLPGEGPWTAAVVGVGSPRDGHQTATLILAPSGARVAATLPRYPEIVPGDLVRVGGRLEDPPPDDGGYGSYLRRIGAVGTLAARTLDREGSVGGPAAELERLRRTAGDALTGALPEPEAGLAAGILVGLRDRVDRDLAAAFTTAGVSHVVAISGWNIAIVAALVTALLRGRTTRRKRAAIALMAIAAYTVFAGASPSVARAAVMAGVVLLARETGRGGTALGALGWAVVGLLALEPGTVSDSGFQLSVLATVGLIAWADPITRRLRSGPGARFPGWLTESLGISFAAEAATLPVVLLGFGRLPVVAPVVNLAVVPLVPPAMAGGLIAGIAGWLATLGLPPPIAAIAGLPGWLVLALMVEIVRLAASLPVASVTVPPPWNAGLAGATAIAVLLAASGRAGRIATVRRIVADLRRRARIGAGGRRSDPGPLRPVETGRRRAGPGTPGRAARALAVGLAMSIALVVVAAADRPDGRVRVTVLDVGQGDAILVEGGRGGRLLVDGGPDPDRLLATLDARLPPWDRRIDLLVLTHPHEDHVAGLALLLARYRVGRVFEPGMIGPGPGYRAWQKALGGLGLHPSTLATGDRFGLDEIRFRVLWPDRGAVPRLPADGGTAINNVSIVLLGEVGTQRFLLAGDIEEGIDPILLARGLPRVDLLKVAHHGSRTASTSAFLDAVRPRVAVVSAGAGNPYGHPAPGTVARIAKRGARLLRTDRDGSVEVTFDGRSVMAVATDRRSAVARPGTGLMARAADAGRPAVRAGAGTPGAGSILVAAGGVGAAAFTCGIPPPS